MFGRRFRRGLRNSMSRRRSPARSRLRRTRPTRGSLSGSVTQGSLTPRTSPQESYVTGDAGGRSIKRSQMSPQQKAAEAAFKKAAQERMSGVTSGLKSGSAAARYNKQLEAANKSRTSQSQGRVPIKAIRQQVNPIVDPKRPIMTARPMTQKPQYVRPMYSEGGSVRTPKSNFGTTDYRKTGMTTHTSVRSQKK